MKNIINLTDIYGTMDHNEEFELKDIIPEFLTLAGIKSYFLTYDEEHNVIISYLGDVVETYPSLDAILELQYTNYEKEKAKNDFILIENVCKKLIADGKNLIAGKEMSPDQIERYQAKFNMAVAGESGLFKDEAEMLNVEPEDLINSIITNYNNWKRNLEILTINVEAFRQYIKKLIAEEDRTTLSYVVNYVNLNNDVIDHTTSVSKLIRMLEADFLQK